jgi:hypothetical protein
MSYQDEVFLHDIAIMTKFGELVSGDANIQDHQRVHIISVLATAMVKVHEDHASVLGYAELSKGFEFYFGAGIDGEYAARHPEKEVMPS